MCIAAPITAVNLLRFCGRLSRTSFVYMFWFEWLWWASLKDSLCSSLICGRWKILIWDLSTHCLKALQSTLHQRARSTLSHLTQRVYTYTQTLMVWQRHSQRLSLSHTHMCTHWHGLGPPNQSERSGVGSPRSGWESCWNRSLSQDT